VEAEDCLLWLQNNSEPFTIVQEYWGKTVVQRKEANNGTIYEYFNKFPCLKLPLGYILVRKLKLGLNICIYPNFVFSWNKTLTFTIPIKKTVCFLSGHRLLQHC